MNVEHVSQRRTLLLNNYEQLASKLEQETDPAQVVVLESCLRELQGEIDDLAHEPATD